MLTDDADVDANSRVVYNCLILVPFHVGRKIITRHTVSETVSNIYALANRLI